MVDKLLLAAPETPSLRTRNLRLDPNCLFPFGNPQDPTFLANTGTGRAQFGVAEVTPLCASESSGVGQTARWWKPWRRYNNQTDADEKTNLDFIRVLGS